MKVTITIEDKGAQTVTYDMESSVPDTDTAANVVTPTGVIALAIKAMFQNGMLAEAGSYALEKASEGISPEESIRKKYDHSNS